MLLKDKTPKVSTAKFLSSQTDHAKLPANLPEYAFIGRSNVGKSSLINMLTGNSKLAKVSSTPGKTQTVNQFIINGSWYLVDLPGYGYAKISKTSREQWEKMINAYLTQRENLMCVFVLLDCRIELQKNDLDFMLDLGNKGIPFVIAFTKADKPGKNALQNNIQSLKKELLKYWEELPQTFITSAESGNGQMEILKFIEETNLLF
jgi:GTP-binding protein